MVGMCYPLAYSSRSIKLAFFLHKCLLKCCFRAPLHSLSISIQNSSFAYYGFPSLYILGLKIKASVRIFPLGCRNNVNRATLAIFYSPFPLSPKLRRSFVINPCNNLWLSGPCKIRRLRLESLVHLLRFKP